MVENILQSDLKCIPIQKMVFEQTLGGVPVNSFKPRKMAGEYAREDGVVYKNDICYGKEYPNSYLDIYYSNVDKSVKRPTVVYFHGGGFIFGDKVLGDPLSVGAGKDTDFFADVAKKGYNVVAPNYALAPEYRFPVQLEQTDQVLKYLTEHQEELGLDMECVFLGGGSAGADLAEMYGALLVSPEYAKKVGVTPSINKEQVVGVLIDEAALSVRHFEENMDAMLGCWMGVDEPSKNKETASVLDVTYWIDETYFSSYIISSNMDIWFQDSAEDLVEVMKKNKTDYEYFFREQKYDCLEHGFMKRYQSNRYAKECYEQMLRFMGRQLKMKRER